MAREQISVPSVPIAKKKGSSLGDALGSEKKLKIARNHGKLLCSVLAVSVKPLNHPDSPVHKCGNGAESEGTCSKSQQNRARERTHTTGH